MTDGRWRYESFSLGHLFEAWGRDEHLHSKSFAPQNRRLTPSPTPTGFAEIVGDDYFPVLRTLLLSHGIPDLSGLIIYQVLAEHSPGKTCRKVLRRRY